MRARISIWDGHQDTTRHIQWDGSRYTLGRSSACDIRIARPVVSGHHLTFDTEGGEPIVVDAGSTNGTHLNGEPLSPGTSRRLDAGATLAIGEVRIEVTWSSPTEDLDGLTAEVDGDMIADLLGTPGSIDGSPAATLTVIPADGADQTHALPEDAERLHIGSDPEADIPLPAGAPADFAILERTESGFDLVPVSDEGPITARKPLADGWSHRLEEGHRLRFHDPLESQLRELDGPGDDPSQSVPSSATPAATAPPAEPSEAPVDETSAGSSTTDLILIAALFLLLAGALGLVALFFDIL